MLILHNAKIYTLNKAQPTATALVIDHHAPSAGRVLAIGEEKDILDGYGSIAKMQDMEGAVLLPGLVDAHIHLRSYAHGLKKVDLFNLNKKGCVQRVAERVQETPKENWILGHGWSQINFSADFPTAADLDEVAPDHPIYLTATSLHAGWCNTAALKAAKISADTPDPENGQFGRDEHGAPNGMLFEAAMKVVADAIPAPTPQEDIEAIKNAQSTLWEMGLTGVHDFDRIKSFAALQGLHKQGKLKLRVLKNLPVENLDHIIESGLRSGFGDDLLRIGGIKVFADGALGPRTAAMLGPYEDEPNNLGMLFLDGEEFFEHAQKAARHGLRMTVHAIGDKANHEMLNGYAQLRKFEQQENLPARRHRIEHVQLLHPDDLNRLAELNLIASMQPIHATSDLKMADKYWGERSKYGYAWRTMLKGGVTLAFGSDAPVDSANPFWGIHAGVTRQRADGSPDPDGWYPEQRLTVEEAIHAYTTGPAYTAGMEDRLGMFAPSYLADLIALDTDPFTCEPSQLREIQPKATMVGGDWVWDK